MEAARNHSIDKVFVEVDCNSMEHALFLKDHLSRMLNEQVFPEIESWIAQLQLNPKLFYRLPKLDLELQTSKNGLVYDAPVVLVEKIKNQLQQAIRTGTRSRVESDVLKVTEENERQPEAFLHFLKTGSLPWFFTKNEELQLKTILAAPQSFKIALKSLLKENPSARKRLVYQYADAVELWKFISQLRASDGEKVFRAFQTLSKKSSLPAYRESLLMLFTGSCIEAAESQMNFDLTTFFRQLVLTPKTTVKDLTLLAKLSQNELVLLKLKDKVSVEIINNNTLKTNNLILKIKYEKIQNIFHKETPVSLKSNLHELLKPVTDLKVFRPKNNPEHLADLVDPEVDSALLPQAGLVLLHPFLPALFSELQFIDETKQLKKSKRDEAVHLLHFLATGNLKPHEAELGFEKYLCGLPSQYPVRKDISLSPKQQEEAIHLLETAISHWSVLQNTTPAGLRGQFLTRSGKLTFETEKDHLHLQRETADILLDQLPWGLTLMRLPWLKKLVYINW